MGDLVTLEPGRARCRFVQPETVRISISDGDWIEIKKQLTVGEERKAHASLIKEIRSDGRVTPDLEMLGKAEVLAYLLDWSLRGPDGKPVDISTDARKSAAVDRMDSASFKEISNAITAHIEALAGNDPKNGQSGETAPSAISSSVA